MPIDHLLTAYLIPSILSHPMQEGLNCVVNLIAELCRFVDNIINNLIGGNYHFVDRRFDIFLIYNFT